MATGRKLEQLKLDEFTAGCNYDADITSLKENESPNAINVVFDENVIRKRTGYASIANTGTSTDIGYALFDFGVAGVGHKLVAHVGPKVYRMSNLDGVLTSIRNAAPQAVSYMTEVNQKLVHTFSDYSAPYYWDGATPTMAILSLAAPGFKHAIETQGFLLGGNISGNTLRVYYEDINTMIGGAYADFFTLTGELDDEITGWFIINGRTYASTKTGIYRISFIGGVAVFEFKQVISDVGVIPRTAKTVISNEFGQVVIFLGYDLNFYLFDGSFIRDISQNYRIANNDTPIAPSHVELNRTDNFNATYDSVSHVYSCYVTAKGNTTNKFSFNIDIRNLAYYPFDNMIFNATAIAEDEIGRTFRVGADYSGNIHKQFGNYNNDNGVAIVENYESPPLMQTPAQRNKGIELDMYLTPVGHYSLQFDDRTNFDKTWKTRDPIPMFSGRDKFLGLTTFLGTTAMLGSEVELLAKRPNIPVTANSYRFRVHSGGPDDVGIIVQYTTGTVAGTGGGTSITGTGTAWTSYMTAANGYRIHIKSGLHANTTYTFNYISATTATVGTMAAGNFTGVAYEIYRREYAPAGPAWQLVKGDFLSSNLGVGRTEPQR
jgi:hypothetical protein